MSATTIYVNVDNLPWWDGHVRVTAWGGSSDVTQDYSTSDKVYIRGKGWYAYTLTNGNTNAQIRYNNNGSDGTAYSAVITPGSDDVCYVMPYDTKDVSGNYLYNYLNAKSTPTCRNNINNNWEDASGNMTRVDDNTFTFEWSKTDIDTWRSDDPETRTDIWFRIWYWDTQLYRYADGDRISIGGSTSTYNTSASESTWSFGIPIPTTYNYEKIVVKVVSNSSAAGYTIYADAYISKTIGETGYATFGSNANVDFSKAIPATANTSFSAYKGKVQSGGSITYLDTSTLYGGEGALLVGNAGTYSIPVTAAEVSADTEHNDFKAVDIEQQVAQTSGSNKRYILTKKIVGNDDAHLGFYKVNSDGSWCAANTAYLETSISPAKSREYFPLLFETSGVENIKNDLTESNGTVYDLQGRRVINPKKGLYIVNGKKVIM